MAWIDYKKDDDMRLLQQSWILHRLKMYKTPHEVIPFIEETMETWRVELVTGVKSLAEVKIRWDIFQRDPLLFVISIMLLNPILRKCTAGYNLNKSQEKINY